MSEGQPQPVPADIPKDVPAPEVPIVEAPPLMGPPIPPELEAQSTNELAQIDTEDLQHVENISGREKLGEYVGTIADTLLRSKQDQVAKETEGLDDEEKDEKGRTARDLKIEELGVQALDDFIGLKYIKDGDYSAPKEDGTSQIDFSGHPPEERTVEYTQPNGEKKKGQIESILKVDGDTFTCTFHNPEDPTTPIEGAVKKADILASYLKANKDILLSSFSDPSHKALMEMHIDIAQNGIDNATTLRDTEAANKIIQEAGQSIGMLTPADELAAFNAQIARFEKQATTPGVPQVIQELRLQRDKRRQELEAQEHRGELFLNPSQIVNRARVTIETTLNQAQGELNALIQRKSHGEKGLENAIKTTERVVQELKDQQAATDTEGELAKGITALQNGELSVEQGQKARNAYRNGNAEEFADAIAPTLEKKSADALKSKQRKEQLKKGKKITLLAGFGSAALLLFLLRSGMSEQ